MTLKTKQKPKPKQNKTKQNWPNRPETVHHFYYIYVL